MIYKFNNILLNGVLGFALFLVSCTNNQHLNTGKIKIIRFEQELFACKQESDFKKLHVKYPEFYESFCRDILNIATNDADRHCTKALTAFINHRGIKALKKDVDSLYTNLADLESDLFAASENFYKNFNNQKFPTIITFISEYSFANVTYDTLIGIGLDMYLGSGYPYYKTSQIDFPEFMANKLQREYILCNTLKAFGISRFEHQLKDKKFLAFILFEGKIRYFVKQLLPQLNDSILFGYTANQLAWCKENESQMWAHYIDKKLLYSSEVEKFMRYINDGPFTIAEGVPQESAPAIGVYTGYKIIEEFAKQEQATLKEVMENNNWDEILKKSKYKP